jgi:N-acetylglucosaminyldiphosphoundecaprenol N-acetyl-beta-D-mannosaminyltransferase
MRVSLFDCPIDIVTMEEALDGVRQAIARGEQLHHVAMNVAKVINMRTDPELAADVKAGHLVTIDGMGIVYALKMRGYLVPGRVTGIDLMERVVAMCAEEGRRPYLLGAKPAIVRKAANKLVARYPSLAIAGCRDGYFGSEDEAAVVADIVASKADCLFVAMPTPRKERFLAKYRADLKVPFVMGVGGSFDVIAGHVDRAPPFMQRHGLEWLYRIYQEPGRMWWRYVRTNTIFGAMLVSDLVRRRA